MIRYTIADVRRINTEKGWLFFNRDTMKFWKCQVESSVYTGPSGVFFVTSEKVLDQNRRFTVRQFDPETGRIWTPGEIPNFSIKGAAKEFAKQEAKKLPKA